MDKYILLNNINLNFNKLFTECKDGLTYTPVKFETSNDSEALLVLCQILELMNYIRNNNDITGKLIRTALYNIITIKCKEFVSTIPLWNSNYNNFILSFEEYLNKSFDELN